MLSVKKAEFPSQVIGIRNCYESSETFCRRIVHTTMAELSLEFYVFRNNL